MNKQNSLLVMGQTNHGKTTLINAINSSTNNNYKYINFETNKELTNQNINTAILVVNVLEGAMTQTREHILYAKQLGINQAVIAYRTNLNKNNIHFSRDVFKFLNNMFDSNKVLVTIKIFFSVFLNKFNT